jgi:hypothetical protein
MRIAGPGNHLPILGFGPQGTVAAGARLARNDHLVTSQPLWALPPAGQADGVHTATTAGGTNARSEKPYKQVFMERCG